MIKIKTDVKRRVNHFDDVVTMVLPRWAAIKIFDLASYASAINHRAQTPQLDKVYRDLSSTDFIDSDFPFDID